MGRVSVASETWAPSERKSETTAALTTAPKALDCLEADAYSERWC